MKRNGACVRKRRKIDTSFGCMTKKKGFVSLGDPNRMSKSKPIRLQKEIFWECDCVWMAVFQFDASLQIECINLWTDYL